MCGLDEAEMCPRTRGSPVHLPNTILAGDCSAGRVIIRCFLDTSPASEVIVRCGRSASVCERTVRRRRMSARTGGY